MIIYNGTRAQFLTDSDGYIEDVIADQNLKATGRYVLRGEFRSRRASPVEMARVLRDLGLTEDVSALSSVMNNLSDSLRPIGDIWAKVGGPYARARPMNQRPSYVAWAMAMQDELHGRFGDEKI